MLGWASCGSGISWSGLSANLPPLLRKIFTSDPSPSRHTTAMSGLPSPSMSPKAAEAAPMFHAATTTFFCVMRKYGSGFSGLIRPQPPATATATPAPNVSAGPPAAPWPGSATSGFSDCSLRRLARTSLALKLMLPE